MKNNKGFPLLVIAIIVITALVVGVGAYFLRKNSNQIFQKTPENMVGGDKYEHCISSSGSSCPDFEDSTLGGFGAIIKSLKVLGPIKWELDVDIISNNPEWKWHGGVLPFVNKYQNIIPLVVDKNTKTYTVDCSGNANLVEVSSFISGIQSDLETHVYNYNYGVLLNDGTKAEEIWFKIDSNNIITMRKPICTEYR